MLHAGRQSVFGGRFESLRKAYVEVATFSLSFCAALGGAALAEEAPGDDPARMGMRSQMGEKLPNAQPKNAKEAQFFEAKVLRNKPLGENTRLVRLALGHQDLRLPYEAGSYVVVRGLSHEVDDFYPFGKMVSKPYLPIQPLDRKGHFDIIVKTYPYPDGDTARFLENCGKGSAVHVAGPVTRPEVAEKLRQGLGDGSVKKIGMVVGGAGMTSAIQFIRCFLGEKQPKKEKQKKVPSSSQTESDIPPPVRYEISILASDRSVDDIFYQRELDRLMREFPDQLKVYRTLTREAPKNWTQGVGRISAEMLRKHLPEADGNTTIVVCGPDSFVKHVAGTQCNPNAATHSSIIKRGTTSLKHHPEKEAVYGGLLKQAGIPDTCVLVL